MMREYADYGIGMCLDEKEFTDFMDLLCKEKDLDPDTYEINDDACREVLDLNDGWASGIVRYNVKTEELDEPERLFVFKARKFWPSLPIRHIRTSTKSFRRSVMIISWLFQKITLSKTISASILPQCWSKEAGREFLRTRHL